MTKVDEKPTYRRSTPRPASGCARRSIARRGERDADRLAGARLERLREQLDRLFASLAHLGALREFGEVVGRQIG